MLLLRPSGYAVNSASNGDVDVTQIDTSANDVFASFPLSTVSNTFEDRIVAGNGALWAADIGVISRINPASGKVTKKIATSHFGTSAITVGAGTVVDSRPTPSTESTRRRTPS